MLFLSFESYEELSQKIMRISLQIYLLSRVADAFPIFGPFHPTDIFAGFF